MYDSQGEDDSEMNLTRGSTVGLISDDHPDWWLLSHGRNYGFAPSNYVNEIDSSRFSVHDILPVSISNDQGAQVGSVTSTSIVEEPVCLIFSWSFLVI
jgi:hypothetical protein